VTLLLLHNQHCQCAEVNNKAQYFSMSIFSVVAAARNNLSSSIITYYWVTGRTLSLLQATWDISVQALLTYLALLNVKCTCSVVMKVSL